MYVHLVWDGIYLENDVPSVIGPVNVSGIELNSINS